MRICITRHGETDWNKIHRTQGRTDLELNDCGRQQARRLALRLQSRGLCAVYTSPMGRAVDTGRIVCEETGARLVVDERLNERDFGPLEGLTFSELVKKYPKEMDTWLNDPYAHVQEGVEPIPDILDRIVSFLADLQSNHTQRDAVLIVTHGTVAGLMVLHLMDLPISKLHHFGMTNCSLTQIVTGVMHYPFLSTLNDTAHLEVLE